MAKGHRGGKRVNGVKLTPQQEKQIEDDAQFNDAKRYALIRGAKYVEYTDANGKVRKDVTGNKTGGTYRTSYSDDVANYAKMSTNELQSELKDLQDVSTSNYMKFTRAAASRSGSLLSTTANADTQIRMIKQVLRRRNVKMR